MSELIDTDIARSTAARRRKMESGLLGGAEHVLVTVVQLRCGPEPVPQAEAALCGGVGGRHLGLHDAWRSYEVSLAPAPTRQDGIGRCA